MSAAEPEPIRIVSPDPEWPARFEQERSALAEAIGEFATGGIHHVHLAPVSGQRYRDELEFRDRLRADPDLAQRYADLKLALARRFKHDREGYTQAKAAFIHEALTDAS